MKIIHEFSVNFFGTVKYSWKSHSFPTETKNVAFPWKFHCAKMPQKSDGMPVDMPSECHGKSMKFL